MIMAYSFLYNLVSYALIVCVETLIAAFDHLHPTLAILDKGLIERFPHRITRAFDRRVALKQKIVLHDIPGQFMGKLKNLDQALFFQIG